MALLLATLGVSILSSYDAEVRWLRFGSVLLAVGLAMWLPALWAAALTASISLFSGLLRGGTGDLGILRPETLLEAVGLAATALLAAWLRDQIAFLVESASQPSATEEAVRSKTNSRPARGMPIPSAAVLGQSAASTEPAIDQPSEAQDTGLPIAETAVVQTYQAPSLLAFHPDESLASYSTYLACLRLELAKTAGIIQEVRSCAAGDEEDGLAYEETLPAAAADGDDWARFQMERLLVLSN
jgi:hypothetical protein